MARSHLTLAALATSAVPGLVVTGSGQLGRRAAGDFDSALLRTDDDRDLVVRAPRNERSASEQSVELLALQAMSDGIRSRLPFEVPQVIGQVPVAMGRAVVYSYLPGYTIDAAELPPGDGAATSIGAAIAALHSLPGSFVASAGLPHLSAAECRAEARNVVERASAAGRLPAAVKKRWLDAVGDDAMWQFQPTVVNGGFSADSFIITDHDAGPIVTGVIGWSGLKVADPARDLHWLSGAGDASASVFAAYRTACTRPPDRQIMQRSLLHAELELARWLLHGIDTRDDEIVDDAVGMLDGLVDSVLGDLMYPLTPQTGPIMAVGEVEAMLQKAPPTRPPGATAFLMETDSYDRDDLTREFDTATLPRLADETSRGGIPEQADAAVENDQVSAEDLQTSPIDIVPDHDDSAADQRSRSSFSE